MMRKIQRLLTLMSLGMSQAHTTAALGGDIYVPMI